MATLKGSELNNQQLLKKSVISKQLLDVAEKIDPGMSKWRGQILFELQSASVILGQRALDERRLDRWKAQVRHVNSYQEDKDRW